MANTLTRLVLAVLGVTMMTAAHAEVQLYVAANGHDDSPGTKEQPLATLAHARDLLRDRRQTGAPRETVQVLVREGTYYLREPLVLEPGDSGTAQEPVTFRAYPGEKVVLSGGRPITGWRRDQGEIWMTNLPEVAAGNWYFRQLFADGKRQIRARHPNFDPASPYKGGWLFARTPPGWAGDFDRGVHMTQVPGTTMAYDLAVPATGHYFVWMRQAWVAATNVTYHQISDMSGATEIKIGDLPAAPLMNLPASGGWTTHVWGPRPSAEIDLIAGPQHMVWTNVKGGGINPDAWVFTDDPNWRPALPLPPVAEGKHLFVVQAERPVKTNSDILFFEDFYVADRDLYVDPGIAKAAWQAPDAVLNIFPYKSWFSDRIAIEQVDPARNHVILARNVPGRVFAGNRFFVENVREELDSPGEWYLDRRTGNLYYWPTDPAFPTLTITAPAMDRLIVLAGTPDAPVEHITISGFIIKDVDFGDQQDVYYPAHAAVHLYEANNCRIANCDFLSVGGYAVWLKGACQGNVISGNEVAEPGAGGVFVDGSAYQEGQIGGLLHRANPDGRIPVGNLITENYIHHCGRIYAHVGGVYINRAAGNRVTHNLITDVSRYGLSVKGRSPDNELEYNIVLRTNLETNDTGGIESWGNPGPLAIRYNIVGDTIGLKPTSRGEIISPTFGCGVYLDGEVSQAEVRGNIVYRQAWSGLTLNSGHDNIVENNVFVDSQDRQFYFSNYAGTAKGNRLQRNVFYWRRAESTLGIGTASGPEYLDSDYNLFWLPDGKVDLTALQAKQLDVHSLIADPLFVDPNRDDYRLKPDSPAFELGFQRIPVDRIGPQGRFKGSG